MYHDSNTYRMPYKHLPYFIIGVIAGGTKYLLQIHANVFNASIIPGIVTAALFGAAGAVGSKLVDLIFKHSKSFFRKYKSKK